MKGIWAIILIFSVFTFVYSFDEAFAVLADFNGDGFDDMAVGVPFKDAGGDENAGAASVIYGSATGLNAFTTPSQIWHLDSPGVAGVGKTFENYGLSISAGDFNNDGFEDMAVSIEGKAAGGDNDAGAVSVIYGSATGLNAFTTPSQIWHLDSPGVAGTGRASELYGFSISTGDFNNDGFDDMAVGVPVKAAGGDANAGAASVIYGSATGLNAFTTPSQIWHLDSPGVAGTGRAFELYGFSISTGDFNNDMFDDMAVGVPFKDAGGDEDAGAASVIYGSATGLNAFTTPSQIWHLDSPGVAGIGRAGDEYGSSITAGDFNDDGFDDMAVGIDRKDAGGDGDAGAVSVIYGSMTGLNAVTVQSQIWHLDRPGVAGIGRAGDSYGDSITVGDFNGDGFDDVAVGIPGKDAGGDDRAGAASVIYGSNSGLNAVTVQSQIWHLDRPGVAGIGRAGEEYGDSITVGDFNNDGFEDMAVGIPEKDAGGDINAGAVSVIYGSMTGLNAVTVSSQIWHLDSPGVAGTGKAGENFGFSLLN